MDWRAQYLVEVTVWTVVHVEESLFAGVGGAADVVLLWEVSWCVWELLDFQGAFVVGGTGWVEGDAFDLEVVVIIPGDTGNEAVDQRGEEEDGEGEEAHVTVGGEGSS